MGLLRCSGAAERLTLTPTALQRDMRGRVISVIGCIAIAVMPTVLIIVGEAVLPQMVAARLNELQHGPSRQIERYRSGD